MEKRAKARNLAVMIAAIVGTAVYALTAHLGDRDRGSSMTQRVGELAGSVASAAPAGPPADVKHWGALDVLSSIPAEPAPDTAGPTAASAETEVPSGPDYGPGASLDRGRVAGRSHDRPRRARRHNVGQVDAPAEPAPTAGVMARFQAPPERKPRTRADIAEVPNRDTVAGVIGSARAQIQECYDRGMVPGDITLTLTMAGASGHVERAAVSDSSSTASCIRRVARQLRFPRFAREHITIRYPLSFR